jgi:predicted NBD/HSP70 family sugar kinase
MAARYRISPDAGCVIGIDAGSTHIRIKVHTLDGTSIYEDSRLVSQRQRHINQTTVSRVHDLVVETTEHLTAPIRAATLAVPTSVSTVFREQPDQAALIALQRDLKTLLGPNIELFLENNVNCAAVGEQFYGAGRGYPTFAYFQLGVKVGLGIVHDTHLLRGAAHAAGEPSRIPFPWTPEIHPTPGHLEQYLGATAFMQRVRQKWPTGSRPPKDTSELFSLAEQGVIPACGMVDDHAEDIGRLLATVVAILDPGLVILGGGIGQNSLLLRSARETLKKLAWSTEVRSTQLGDEATVLGATTLATTQAMNHIL